MKRSERKIVGSGAMALFAVLCVAAAALWAIDDPAPARASGLPASAWADEEIVRVRLVSSVKGTAGLGPGETYSVGVQIVLQDGWKTYWRDPGDAGMPPVFDWSGSSNVSVGAVKWPAPHRSVINGLVTLGYDHEVVFPVEVSIINPGEPALIDLELDYAVCEEICVPVEADLSLELPADAGGSSYFVPLLDRYLSRVADGTANARGLAVSGIHVAAEHDPALLLVKVEDVTDLGKTDLFVEGPPGLRLGTPEKAWGAADGQAVFAVPVTGRSGTAAAMLSEAELRLTITDGARALETTWSAPASTDGATAP